MKKLILGMMLIIGSLSFSVQKDRGIDENNFENLKMTTGVNYIEEGNSSSDRLLFGISSQDRD